MTTIPFTYLLVHKSTGMRYYGVRYKRGCTPADLWTTYFTSSKVIKRMLAEEGRDAFTYEIRRVFKTGEAATAWEAKVQRRLRVDLHEGWINQHAQSCNFNFQNRQHSPETKEKIRQAMRARRLTKEHRAKIAAATRKQMQQRREEGWTMPRPDVERRAALKRGIPRTKEMVAKMRATKTGTKRHYLPDGSFIMVKPT